MGGLRTGAAIDTRSDDLSFERIVAPVPLTPPGYPHPPVFRATAPVRGTLPLLIERESWPIRLAWAVVVLFLLSSFFLFSSQFRVAAHPGTDQNAYLVGARNFAAHTSTGFKPSDPYLFVGRMWVSTSDGWYYPKYPFGFPLIAAMVLKICGAEAVYLINPVLMTGALLGVFLLGRTVAGSFAGMLAMLIFATSPLALALTNNPNSHASALFFVTWGMYLLIRWWQHGSFWRAALAGVLLGYAGTIRHSEVLLTIPLLAVTAFNLQPSRGRSWGQAGTLLACFVFPLFLCIVTSYTATGTLNSYSLTHEDRAFTLDSFQRNWAGMVRNLANQGMFLTLSIGVLGLMLLTGRSGRLALVLALWCVLPVLLYMSYYWAPETAGMGNLRFVLTALPPLAVTGGWCLTRAIAAPTKGNRFGRWCVAPLSALLLVIAGGAYAIHGAWNMLESERRNAQAVEKAARAVMEHLPAGSVVLAPREVCHHLQFVGDYTLYCTDDLDPHYIRSLANVDPDQPNGLQPQRAVEQYRLFREPYKTEAEFHKNLPGDLAKLARKLAAGAIGEGKRVGLVARAPGNTTRSRFSNAAGANDGKSFTLNTLATWAPPNMPMERMQLLEITLQKP